MKKSSHYSSRRTRGRTVFVSGGAGYLGSVLCRRLLSSGYRVICFDRLYFGTEPIQELLSNRRFTLVRGNILRPEDYAESLKKADAVMHLSGIANDPTGELHPELTDRVNHRATVEMAEAAKAAGVGRFLFASSCSVYGKGLTERIDEGSAVNPISIYAESKVKAEQALFRMASDRFAVTSLRQATLFGLSPRMRFDLAINVMVLHGYAKKKIFVWGGGKQWRPFLHVADAASAFVTCLGAPASKVNGKTYNTGATHENYQILDLARLVQQLLPGTELELIPDNPDARSYRVVCDRIHEELGWKAKVPVAEGVREIVRALRRGDIKHPEHSRFYNIKTFQEFLKKPAILGDGEPVRHTLLEPQKEPLQFIKEVAARYDASFAQMPELEVLPRSGESAAAFGGYPLLLNLSRLKIGRAAFAKALRAENIGTATEPLQNHALMGLDGGRTSPRAAGPGRAWASRLILLPLNLKMTTYDVECVMRAVGKLVEFYKVASDK